MSVNLLTLLDDIASMMDDVSIMTKIAMKKTSGIITDDLAVNVGQVDGVDPKEELPTVFKIFAGSLVNKAIIIPFVLLLTYYSPVALSFILLAGGIYLSYEGAHKIIEKITNVKVGKKKKVKVDTKKKIWGAIKTDFVLSIEIMVIAQSTLSGDVTKQALSLCIIGLLISVLIYGLVAILVKVDDFGLLLTKNGSEKFGMFLINLMPKMMKALGVIGTVAMLLVGGEIFAHHFHFKFIPIEFIQNILVGLLVGLVAVGVLNLINILKQTIKKA
jgi:predicted DNA repair protein MutK